MRSRQEGTAELAKVAEKKLFLLCVLCALPGFFFSWVTSPVATTPAEAAADTERRRRSRRGAGDRRGIADDGVRSARASLRSAGRTARLTDTRSRTPCSRGRRRSGR